MSPTRRLIILNPASGHKGDRSFIERWARTTPGTRLRWTEGPDDGRRWARAAAEEGVEMVVAAGGDGTVNEVGSGIVSAQSDSQDAPATTLLGIVPLGTGNDLARSLAIPLDPEEALGLLDGGGSSRTLDIMEVELDDSPPRMVLNAVTGGFAGELHESLTDEVKVAWGPLSYLRTGAELWGEHSTWDLEIASGEGEPRRIRALNLVLANGASAGGGIPVAPGADPGDGWMDVLVIRDGEGLELSGLAARMLTRDDPEHPLLVRLRVREVEVRSRRPIPLSLDGEPAEARQIRARMRPARLNVLVPGPE